MKKILTLFCSLFILSNVAIAKTSLNAPSKFLSKDLVKLNKGESFSYPIKEGEIIACYAKKIDGSIDDFEEYNDYFIMRNGNLYSNTMHRIYKPQKANMLKKVDNVRFSNDKKILTMYDPLWEWSIRHHIRRIKINTQTGEYFMKGTQDNWTWYRNIVSSGFCKVIVP